MGDIVVIGGGGHAKVLISVLKKLQWSVLGYTDEHDRGAILGAPYLGPDDVLAGLIRAHEDCAALIGVGKVDASDLRVALQREAATLGFVSPAIVSPCAVVNEEVKLGDGTVVFDGAVANSGAIVGELCILNTSSTVEHDCRLGDDVHVAPGATLSGDVSVGDGCMIGAGATVIQGVAICSGCVIGAGAVVVTDVVDAGVYAGNPARRIR